MNYHGNQNAWATNNSYCCVAKKIYLMGKMLYLASDIFIVVYILCASFKEALINLKCRMLTIHKRSLMVKNRYSQGRNKKTSISILILGIAFFAFFFFAIQVLLQKSVLVKMRTLVIKFRSN